MFNIFKRKGNKENPEFRALATFPGKDKYFYRVAQWDWLSEQEIYIIDNTRPRMITLDAWPQVVFLGADGQLTVTEYLNHLASQYGKDIPNDLDECVVHQLNTLVDETLIAFSDSPRKPDDSCNLPVKGQKGNS